MTRHNNINNHGVLSKMFLISPDTYEKLKTKLREADSLKMLENEANAVLASHTNTGLNADDKWLKYRGLMVKKNEQARYARETDPEQQALNNNNYESERLLNEAAMGRVLKTRNPHRTPTSEKWLKYRDLLVQSGVKRRGADANDLADRLKRVSLEMLSRDFHKIEGNKRLTKSEKLAKYRALLAKHGVRQHTDDGRELSLEQIQDGMKKLGEFRLMTTAAGPSQPKMVNKRLQTLAKEIGSTGVQTDATPTLNNEEILLHAPEEVLTERELSDMAQERLNLSARQTADRLRLRNLQWQAEDEDDDGAMLMDDDSNAELNASNSIFSTPIPNYPHESTAGMTPIRYGSARSTVTPDFRKRLLTSSIRKARDEIRNERLERMRKEQQEAYSDGDEKRTPPLAGRQSYVRSLSEELTRTGKSTGELPTSWKGKDIAQRFQQMTRRVPAVALQKLPPISPAPSADNNSNQRKMIRKIKLKHNADALPYRHHTTPAERAASRARKTQPAINTMTDFFPQSKTRNLRSTSTSTRSRA